MEQKGRDPRINLLIGVENLSGGVLRHILSLCLRLPQKKFNIFLLTSPTKEGTDAIRKVKEAGVSVSCIEMKHRVEPVSDIRAVFLVARFIRRNRIQIIHAHSSKAGAILRTAAALTGIKSVYTPHCYYFASLAGMRKSFYKALEKYFVRHTDAVVVSDNEKLMLLSENFSVDSRYHVINNSLDPDQYIHDGGIGAPAVKTFRHMHPKVCWTGRFCKQKDWKTFMLAAHYVLARTDHEISFVMAGEGTELSKAQRLVGRLGIGEHLALLGNVRNIASVYSGSDMYVSTSLWEGLPYSYLEAVHFGLPMIVTYTPFMEHILEPANCIFFPPGEYRALGDILLDIVSGNVIPQKPVLKTDNGIGEFVRAHTSLYENLCRKP